MGSRVGGLCATFRHGDFSFDCGAHRFHDRNPDVTREIKSLLGDKLKRIHVPSHIYHDGALVNFPFTPFNIARSIGLPAAARAAMEALFAGKQPGAAGSNFENYANATYGKTLSKLFLLNYSEKLWGMSCDRLSAEIAGERLKGFTPQALILEILSGHNSGASHLDGAFYYPEGGIGTITDALAAACGTENIKTNAAVTSVAHENNRITSIIINGSRRVAVDRLVSTLPCSAFAGMMQPAVPEEIVRCAERVHFRDIILAALFFNRDYVTKSATVYFPSPAFSFTRVYEPKNRSACMAPRGKTSLVAEIPCSRHGRLWQMKDEQIAGTVLDEMRAFAWVREEELLDFRVIRVPYAYPVIEKQTRKYIEKIQNYFNSFENLKISGRNGMFRYASIHDMINYGKDMV